MARPGKSTPRNSSAKGGRPRKPADDSKKSGWKRPDGRDLRPRKEGFFPDEEINRRSGKSRFDRGTGFREDKDRPSGYAPRNTDRKSDDSRSGSFRAPRGNQDRDTRKFTRDSERPRDDSRRDSFKPTRGHSDREGGKYPRNSDRNESDARPKSYKSGNGYRDRDSGRFTSRSENPRSDSRPRFNKSDDNRTERKPYKRTASADGFVPDRRKQDDSRDERRPYRGKEKSGSTGRAPFRKPAPYKHWEEKSRRKPGASRSTPRSSGGADGSGVRLNKFIANTGICSRREADDLITAGVISINGTVVTELGTRVNAGDEVRYNGEPLRTERPVYVLLNKPKDFITTTEDPEERKTVMALVADACRERIYPVGRLDRNTTGLLLLTNDGELTKKLTHPSHRVKKVYHVELDRNFTQADMNTVADGVELEDGVMEVDQIAYASTEDRRQVGLEIHSGKNRIVRRLFESLGYEVRKLDRTVFAGLTKKDLPRGRWRMLTEMEVTMLKMVTGSGKSKGPDKATAGKKR